MSTNRRMHLAPHFRRVAIVGVGGTGSYLAQGLAKLVAGYRLPLEVLLIDPDTVEEKNCARQNFMAWEIGRPKAEAMASRINQQYGVAFSFLVGRGDELLAAGSRVVGQAWQFRSGMMRPKHIDAERLIVTCVDTVEARKPFKDCGPWLDLGNGQETGQALYGTTADGEALAGELERWDKTPHAGLLPDPFLVAGMAKLKTKKRTPSCADTPFAEQGVFANEWAANAGLAILHQLLVKGELQTPAIYFDTAKGRMTPGFITREYLGAYAKGEKK